jgi:hypothetical protein
MDFIIRYTLYLLRWQLSTPLLAIVIKRMNPKHKIMWKETIISNLIGGAVFFWIDMLIF